MKKTFKTWAECHVEMKKGEGVGESRIRGIENDINNLWVLHDQDIDKISLLDVQRHINSLALSKKTLQGIRNTAKAIFQLAIDNRFINYNPVLSVKVPRNAATTIRESISEEQQKWIIETPHRAQPLAMIMLFAGLRKGEALALTWEDINLKEKQIEINKSVKFIKNQPVIKAPKTKSGNRTIDIPNILVDYLLRYKKTNTSKYVVSNTTNIMLSEISCRRLWQSYMHDLNIKYGHDNSVKKYHPTKIKSKIQKFTMHQLRHSYATLLYFAGIDVVTARDYLGHSSIQTALNIYTHLDKKYRKNNVIKLDDYIEKTFIGS